MVDIKIGMPTRSLGGLAATDVFYVSYNDYNFYVEDQDQENLYFEILKKKFPNVQLAKIFPLGGKPNVIKHAMEDDSAESTKRVYILDKDFDDLLGKKEKIRGVFYLDRFCIENYLIEEDAIVELVHESVPKEKISETKVNLSLDRVFDQVTSELQPLFAIFYIIQREGLGIKNTSHSPEKFSTTVCRWSVCPDCFNAYLASVSAACMESNIAAPAIPLFDDHRLKQFSFSSVDCVISGKFWLKMIFHYIKSKYNIGSITFESFVYRLAKKCTIPDLDLLVNDVEALYEAA